MAVQDFTRPAVNGDDGCCISCGRDNTGFEGESCAEECPMYWEGAGLSHPEFSAEAA